MKKLILLLVFCCCGLLIFSDQAVVLKGLVQPGTLVVKNNTVFVSETTTVYIYSLSDGRLIRKFGKDGEGPGEFKLPHGENSVKMGINEQHILVDSAAKLSYFSHDGEFIKEFKVPPLHHFIPVEDGFVSSTNYNDKSKFPKKAIALFDRNFKRKKMLLITDTPIGMGVKILVPDINYDYRVYDDKIFLSTGKDKINIKVLDAQGIQLFEIGISVTQNPLTGKFKDEVQQYYKTDPYYKNFWGYMKQYLTFPEVFPPVKNFIVDGGKVYVQTFRQQEDQFQWIIFDIKGNELKTLFLPALSESPVTSLPYSINRGKFYYLQENDETETWELHSLEIK